MFGGHPQFAAIDATRAGDPQRTARLLERLRIVATASPALFFSLIGIITRGLDQPGAGIGLPVLVGLVVLQSLGIVAIAIAAVINSAVAHQRLERLTTGAVPLWRKTLLRIALCLLLLFYVLVNLGAAFAGADLFLVAAGPIFLGFVALQRLAFLRL
jgi:hypothetical protein